MLTQLNFAIDRAVAYIFKNISLYQLFLQQPCGNATLRVLCFITSCTALNNLSKLNELEFNGLPQLSTRLDKSLAFRVCVCVCVYIPKERISLYTHCRQTLARAHETINKKWQNARNTRRETVNSTLQWTLHQYYHISLTFRIVTVSLDSVDLYKISRPCVEKGLIFTFLTIWITWLLICAPWMFGYYY